MKFCYWEQNKQTDKQTNRQTDRQRDKQTNKLMLMVRMVMLVVMLMLVYLACLYMRRRLPKTPLISTEAAPNKQLFTQGFDR